MTAKTIFDMPQLNGTNAPAAHLQRFEVIDENTARAIISYSGDKTQRALDMAVASAFRSASGESSIRAAHNSAIVIDDNGGRKLVDVVLKRNQVSRPFVEAEMAGMHVATANVFVDDLDVIWKLEGEGDARILVQTASEDIKSVLESRRALRGVNIDTASVTHELETATHIGDYALLYNAATESYVSGTVVASGHLYDEATASIVVFDDKEVAVATELPDAVVAAMSIFDTARSGMKDYANAYLSYMETLYKDFPEYFKIVKDNVERVVNQRGLAA